MKRLFKRINGLFSDELDIQHKLLNLILVAAFAGGMFSLTVSILIGVSSSANWMIALLIVVVGLSLWIANAKGRPQVAALLVVIVANMVLFPIMYFTSGGMVSGMPVWLVLGMIFSWLILKGRLCFVMYLLSVLVVVGCILLEFKFPHLVMTLEKGSASLDIIQSIVVVTCIFGAIFKYQTHVYEKQKEQLVRANSAKSEFLANMSHEVRTPINAILGYNEMILQESRESQTASYALNVRTAGRTLLSLVNDILDFTNSEKNQLVLKKETYSIKEILQDVLAYMEYGAVQKGIQIRLEIDEKIPRLLNGDGMRLIQILDNLISNGIKYTKEGYVVLKMRWEPLEEKKGTLRVEVRDTGIGLRAEDVSKISDCFLQFENEKVRDIQGSGLGLTIVTRLLHLMESKLHVQSVPGIGSSFSFEILQEIVDAEHIGVYEREQNNVIQEPVTEEVRIPEARILLVDDNPVNLDLLKGILKNTEVRINTASNGEEALKLLEQESFHMVLMDHMMPIMDGVEALQKIRDRNLCANTPILVLTANAVGNAREQYLKIGFDDYLSKPISSKQLMEAIKRYLPKELLLKKTEGFLGNLSFLDTGVGMEYCCNNEAFYREMLSSYLTNQRLAELEEHFKKSDWENYRIGVHALKGTSLTIGAKNLSEEAKKLEMAVKEKRIEYVQENHRRVMLLYEELLKQLKTVLSHIEPDLVREEIVAEESREHILIVDDDMMNLSVAEKLLGNIFQVDCVRSGQEALDFLQEKIPNLILLDLHMPQMDGFEVNRRLKEEMDLGSIPVIFLTADNDRETEIKGFHEGAMDFITKPFVADIMMQRIKRILELDRLQKNLQQEVKKQTQSAEIRREKLERLTLQTMLTLANTIDAKDKYTNGHSLRVAEYARMIAKRVGKTEQEQEDIYYIGLLHDIGKIGIPDTIINKTSQLSDEEYALIKAHPLIGAEILKNMTEIVGLEIGAHWHHEQYNGKGYPDRLKGQEIPEIARIIGVADAYDAMTSKRSYRDVLPQEVVREQLVKGKGTQFDPVFADVMIELMDEDKEYEMKEHTM